MTNAYCRLSGQDATQVNDMCGQEHWSWIGFHCPKVKQFNDLFGVSIANDFTVTLHATSSTDVLKKQMF